MNVHTVGIACLIMAIGTSLSIAANGPPAFDVRPSCNAAARDAIVYGRNLDACLGDERTAQDEVTKKWSQYSAGDKAQCAGMVSSGGPPSYVELLSCLDIMKDSREILSEFADPRLRTGKPTFTIAAAHGHHGRIEAAPPRGKVTLRSAPKSRTALSVEPAEVGHTVP
jgi:hypothetical protein